MNGLYDILESYRQQNDPRFIYEGLYEQPAYTGPNIDPMYNLGARQFGNMNRMDFGVPQNYYQPDLTTLRGLNMDKFQGVSDMSVIDETTNDEQDQDYINQVNQNNESGIMKILRNLPTFGNLAARILPQEDPRATNMRNFYGNQYGLTSSGSIASGIMQGYNPVYGNDFLNKISGGRIPAGGYGLANAARKRIEKIANRRAPQTDASRAKIAELQRFARQDTANRARFNNPDVYASADRQGFTDPSTGGFKSAGTNENFSNKTGRGRTGY
tara:strand:+ start:56 stop:868 length:813 start_codon:yes stop_codon:yes gene_type:complete